MEKSIEGFVAVTVIVTKEDNQYSSWCPDLDIASCGNTLEEATKNLDDAIELYLNTLEVEGERERVFEKKGIRIVCDDEPIIPTSFVTQYRQKLPVHA